MEELANNFSEQFYQLAEEPNFSFDDKKRTLFSLFTENEHIKSDLPLLDRIKTKLAPTTVIQRHFYIDFLINFNLIKNLHQEIKAGNLIAIKKLKHKPKSFFTSIQHEITVDCILNLLPTLGYNARSKIIRLLAPLMTERSNAELFDALLENYSLEVAKITLVHCPGDKIEQTIRHHRIRLDFWSETDWKLAYGKNNALFGVYLDQNPVKKRGAFIARLDPERFCQLVENYRTFEVKLGRRSTKRLIGADPSRILFKPACYIRIINLKVLYTAIGAENYGKMYKQVHPLTVTKFSNSLASLLLEAYPKKAKFGLLHGTFNELFAIKLENSKKLIDEAILEMAPKEWRERLVALKWGAQPPDDKLKFLPPRQAVELLKRRFNFERMSYDRALLVFYVTDSCIFNNDYCALLDLTNFLVKRLKNDSYEIVTRFLSILYKCDFMALGQEHWNGFKTFFLRPDYDNYSLKQICYEYFEFLGRTNQGLKVDILKIYKERKCEFSSSDFEMYCKKHRFFKDFLLQMCELSPDIRPDFETLDLELILAIKAYNRINDEKIDIGGQKRLLQSILKLGNSANMDKKVQISEALLFMIKNQIDDSKKIKLGLAYWSNGALVDLEGSIWFLKHFSKVINIENLSNSMTFLVPNKKMYNLVKQNPIMAKALTDFCVLSIGREKVDNLNVLVTTLSALMAFTDYQRMLEKYLEENNEIASLLIKNLVNVEEKEEVLQLFIKLPLNHWQANLNIIYQAFNYLNFEKCKFYINEISKKSIKLELLLTTLYLNQREARNLLTQSQDELTMILALRQYNCNRTELNWMIYQKKLEDFSLSYLKKGKTLTKAEGPIKFQNLYTKILWNLFTRTNNKNKPNLVLSIGEKAVENQDHDFFAMVLNDFKLESNKTVQTFVSKFLIAKRDQISLDLLFQALNESDVVNKNEIFNDFIAIFAENYLKAKNVNDLTFLNLLSAKFGEVYQPFEAFKQFVMLELLKLKSQTISQLAKSILTLLNGYVKLFGDYCLKYFATTLNSMLVLLLERDEQRFEFFYTLVCHQKTDLDVILVILLLPTEEEPEDVNSCRFYTLTLKLIESIGSDQVKLFLNLHFKRLNIEEDLEYYQKLNSWSIQTSSWTLPNARRKSDYHIYCKIK